MPMRSSPGSAVGTSSPYTDDGPPESTIPFGAHSRIQSSGRVGGWISQ